jgi:hypothetical protein
MSLVVPDAFASDAEWDAFVVEHDRLGKKSCALAEMWHQRGHGGVLCGEPMSNPVEVSM